VLFGYESIVLDWLDPIMECGMRLIADAAGPKRPDVSLYATGPDSRWAFDSRDSAPVTLVTDHYGNRDRRTDLKLGASSVSPDCLPSSALIITQLSKTAPGGVMNHKPQARFDWLPLWSTLHGAAMPKDRRTSDIAIHSYHNYHNYHSFLSTLGIHLSAIAN
jgi:hypothetical protein